MTPPKPVPDIAAPLAAPIASPLEKGGDDTHKFSRKTVLKDREEALRANLLKRKQQKQIKKDDAKV